MEILLIRHGQSEADLLEVHEGRADFPLTERGTLQATRMAQRVKQEFPPEMIWASTLKRATQTADILQSVIQCPIEYLPELREHDNGDLAGKSLRDTPFSPRQFLPHEKIGTYGESILEFRLRGEQAFSLIRKRSEIYRRIAIVAHGGTISRIIESFLQFPAVHDVFFQTADTGIHLMEYSASGRKVKFMNSATHLQALE